MHVNVFDGRGLLSISPASRSQLMELLIEPHGIFGSNFAYLFLTLSSHCMVCKTLTRLRRGLMVKMLITLEPHSIL